MSTIPASELVSVVPSVLGAGGSGLEVLGLILSTSTRVPAGTVASFANGEAVSDYFGPESVEAIVANGATNRGSGYFGGFDNSNKKPGSILFTQYNEAAVSAYVRGGDVSALTVAQIQAITGSLNIVIDGVARNDAAVDLSAATSFSSAAGIIATNLNASIPAGASVTASIAGNVLTVTAVGSGIVAPAQTVTGTGVDAGLYITAQITGTSGGIGTYRLSSTDTVSSEAMTTAGTPVAVTYDSVSGGFIITSGVVGAISTAAFATGTIAASLKLTSATGATLSQGAAAASPATFMDAAIIANSNFVTFMTAFDPDADGENTVKQAFAAWANGQDDRFVYVCWDLDQAPVAADPAAASLGAILAANGNSGTFLIDGDTNASWAEDIAISTAAFVCGAAASIDFTQRSGRISFAYRAQDGLLATVTDPTAARNLGGDPQSSGRGNGYNFYGGYGAANAGFIWLQRGFVTGDFLWLDSFINQVWLNSQLQIAILNLLQNVNSIPYSTAGYGMIEAALADPIQAGLSFGAFGPGPLSSAQIAQVNAEAGKRISDTLISQGYYLQIGVASASTRSARTSPPAKFWYVDNGAIQAIDLSSVALI